MSLVHILLYGPILDNVTSYMNSRFEIITLIYVTNDDELRKMYYKYIGNLYKKEISLDKEAEKLIAYRNLSKLNNNKYLKLWEISEFTDYILTYDVRYNLRAYTLYLYLNNNVRILIKAITKKEHDNNIPIMDESFRCIGFNSYCRFLTPEIEQLDSARLFILNKELEQDRLDRCDKNKACLHRKIYTIR